MTDTYSILGTAGKITAPGVWEFKGENWHAVLTQWGADLVHEKSTWSVSFNVGSKHLFESLSKTPGEAIACIERQVWDMQKALARIALCQLCQEPEYPCWRCRHVRPSGHCGAPDDAGPCSEEERQLFEPA